MARRDREREASSSAVELAMRADAELAAQGLMAAIADASTLRRVASLLGAEDPNVREKRLANARRELTDIEIRIPLFMSPGQGIGESS